MILFLHDDTLFFMEVIMRTPAPFPENSRELIGNSLKRAKTKSEFQRVQCLWLRITLGLAEEQIAEAIGWHVDEVSPRFSPRKEGITCAGNRIQLESAGPFPCCLPADH